MGQLDILIIDDSGFDRVDAAAYLKPHAVREADSVESGLREVRKKAPDLIVLDINFKPGTLNQDGIDKVLKPLRTEGYTGKIICYSSDLRYENITRGAGADGFVPKQDMRKLRLFLPSSLDKPRQIA